MKVAFLSRPGCHLCDEALAGLREHLAGKDPDQPVIEIEEIDIESDDRLHRLYLERIPVIRIGEETISELVFDPEEFDAAVDRHRQALG